VNKSSVQNLEGMISCGRCRCTFENNIKVDLKEECEDLNWINLAEGRVQWKDVVSTVINLQFHEQTTNSVALVRERTIPTERPSLVGEVSATFCGYRVSRGQRNESPRRILGSLDRSM
jgi:hypothetical protein